MLKCPQCGNDIKKELYCPKCKTPIEDNISEKISGYLFFMANSYYLARQYKDAEHYAEKLVKTVPKNPQAWLLKGNIQAYSSPGDDLSYGKSIKAWSNAINSAKDGNEIMEIKKNIANEMFNGFAYSSYLRAVEFSRNPSKANNIALQNCKKYFSVCDLLNYKIGVDLSEDVLSDFLANQMIGAAVHGSEYADEAFGTTPEERTPEKFTTWLMATESCTEMLINAADFATKPTTAEDCYKRAISFQRKMMEAKAYKPADKPKAKPIQIGLESRIIADKNKIINSYVKMQMKKVKELQKRQKAKK